MEQVRSENSLDFSLYSTFFSYSDFSYRINKSGHRYVYWRTKAYLDSWSSWISPRRVAGVKGTCSETQTHWNEQTGRNLRQAEGWSFKAAAMKYSITILLPLIFNYQTFWNDHNLKKSHWGFYNVIPSPCIGMKLCYKLTPLIYILFRVQLVWLPARFSFYLLLRPWHYFEV